MKRNIAAPTLRTSSVRYSGKRQTTLSLFGELRSNARMRSGDKRPSCMKA